MKIHSNFIKKIRSIIIITALLAMTNQSFGGQTSVEGKVTKISDSNITIETTMANSIPAGSRVDLFFEISEDKSILIGQWKVSIAGNGEVFSTPVNMLSPPQKGMTAKISFTERKKQVQVMRQNHHNAPPISQYDDTQSAKTKFEPIEPELRGKEPKGQLLGIPFPEKSAKDSVEEGNKYFYEKNYKMAQGVEKEKYNTLKIVKKNEDLESETQKMFEALYVNDLKTVREQLNKGVSANAKNDVGQTPLHVTQDLAILKLLISSGADVDSSDGDGRTPIFNKEIELIKVLIVAGADIHHRSNKGNTLLIWYSYSGYLEGIQYIVSLGADVNGVNLDGQTAHDIAEHFAHFKLLEYLISIGAQPGK